LARWIKDTIARQERSPEGFGGRDQVRSYVEGRGAKDARSGIERDFDATLDGDLDDFLLASLSERRR
jgi:hypothetical protein